MALTLVEQHRAINTAAAFLRSVRKVYKIDSETYDSFLLTYEELEKELEKELNQTTQQEVVKING